MSENTFKPGASRALFFSTTAFAVSFAVWGLIAALAPQFTEIYKLSATEKSLMIAIPVLLGSIGRLFAGMAADRFGGRVVFAALLVFSAIPAVAVGLSTSYPQLLIFALLLGCAAALGLGNGAVFKLVPQYFPKETGTVTGLVGAFGGLGGFFPPLELGLVKDATGSYTIGFVLLAVFALLCLAVNYFTFLRDGGKTAEA